jgi:hypothetical protein
MKTYRNVALFICAVTLLDASRGRADEKDDIQKILGDVAELRRVAAELSKQAEARAEETRGLQKALDECRLSLTQAQEQASELKLNLASAETELEAARKNNLLLEKLVAELDRKEPRKLIIVDESRPPEIQVKAPERELHGKVAGIADAGLYVVSVGSDEGMRPTLTLEVFKADDKTKRIGVITLVRCYSKQAIGEFRPDGNERAELGDEVVARIAAK